MKPSQETRGAAKPQQKQLSYADAINHAASLLGAGRLDDAERLCMDILRAKSDDYNAALLLGIVKSQQGKQDDALGFFDRALRANPKSYEALFNSAMTLQALQREADALDRYDRTLAVKTDCLESLNNRGNALQALKRHHEAIDSYDKALALKSDFTEALNNRGNALRALGHNEEAIADFDRALLLHPNHVQVLNHRGGALQALQRYAEALASYEKALSLDARYAEAWSNRGVTLQSLHRYQDAMTSFDTALAHKPDYADALWNKSLLLLLIGDFEQGWKLYEWRRNRSDASLITPFAAPLWLGREDLRGKRILLHAEQGLGDTIQFSRYAKQIAADGAIVILAVPQSLRALLTTIDGVGEVVSPGDPTPQFDYQCPVMSLPFAMKTSLSSVPCEIPYLKVEPAWVAKWSARLGPRTRPRIGFAWSTTTAGENRSLPLTRLTPLFALPLEWICLQKDISENDCVELDKLTRVRRFDTQIVDFSDTAALAQLCDLVISIDTAVAHVAGALGKPLWVVLPFASEWRWLIDRSDSPWYATARLFRTTAAGDWSGTIHRVEQQLKARMRPGSPNKPAAT